MAPMRINGVPYFPVEAIVSALGVSAAWASATNTLHIGTPVAPAPSIPTHISLPPENPMRRRNTFDLLLNYQREAFEFRDTDILSVIAGFYTSLAPFTSIGLEAAFGFTAYLDPDNPSGNRPEDTNFYYSISPTMGLVIPITNSTQLFSNFIISAGNFGAWRGMITNNITPGFDVGFTLHDITLKFRGMWYQNVFTHAIAFGISSRRLR